METCSEFSRIANYIYNAKTTDDLRDVLEWIDASYGAGEFGEIKRLTLRKILIDRNNQLAKKEIEDQRRIKNDIRDRRSKED